MAKKLSSESALPNATTDPAASAVAGATGPPGQTHCPYRQANLLQQALTPDKMRIAFFLGAGCPVAIRVPDGSGTKPLIPNIEGLTTRVCELLAKSSHGPRAAKIIQRVRDNGSEQPNIEEILTHIRGLHEIIGNGTIDDLSKQHLTDIDKEICEQMTIAVNVRLPNGSTPYHQLATWIRSIQRTHPVEIFTSNYDLLMEQALEDRQVPYFDGFLGSDRTFFDISAMEQDILPARWARLWKVHGSINWWRTNFGDIERRRDSGGTDRQMIYPSHIKYVQSRRMPYLAMQDRLRAFLVRGQSVLITCGYSFSDQHLNDVITQGLRGNPTAVCFALMFDVRAKAEKAVAHARTIANLTVLASDGAVLGTNERNWAAADKNEHPLHGLAVQSGGADKSPCKFVLGDFSAFGGFLANQLNQLGSDEGDKNGS